MDYSNMDLRWENMLAGIKAQVPFLRDAPHAIYKEIKESVEIKEAPSRVYLTGCGDSWYCGMATRFAFEEWSGLPTAVPQAMEFSRYQVKYAPQDSVVISVSNSGRVSRTIETAVQANQHGLYTIGCTSNLDEGLSQEVDAVIDLAYGERRFAPGTSSYMASLTVQYCLALYFAEIGGGMDEGQVAEKLDEISALADGMDRTIEENESIYELLGTEASMEDQFVFIGGGPNLGTAFFSMAKMIESARLPAIGQELEEWAHEQYFVTDEDTYTFVLAPTDSGLDRAREQLYAINEMGSTSVVICDPESDEIQVDADYVIPIYGKPDWVLSPLLYCVPGEMFAFFFAATKDLTMLGFDDEHVKEVNFKQIFHSEILRSK